MFVIRTKKTYKGKEMAYYTEGFEVVGAGLIKFQTKTKAGKKLLIQMPVFSIWEIVEFEDEEEVKDV